MPKTHEEIQALKENWLKDPCWDIEDTEDFGDYHDEFLAFRRQTESEWAIKRTEREQKRHELVMEETGVADANITTALFTFNEIEGYVLSQDHYIEKVDYLADQVKIELMQAQIRATLLQAAQLKRIADALEHIDDADSVVESTRIFGSIR